jgi:hypothetical protein
VRLVVRGITRLWDNTGGAMQHLKKSQEPEALSFSPYSDYPLLISALLMSLVAVPADWSLAHWSFPDSEYPTIDMCQRVVSIGLLSLMPIAAPIVIAIWSMELVITEVVLIITWTMCAIWSAVAVFLFIAVALMEPGTGSAPNVHTIASAEALWLTPWQYTLSLAVAITLFYLGAGPIIYMAVSSIRERWLRR